MHVEGVLGLRLHAIHGPSTLIIVNSPEKRRGLVDVCPQLVRKLAGSRWVNHLTSYGPCFPVSKVTSVNAMMC